MEKGEVNWSEDVEDLVTAGDTQAAISFFQNLLPELQATSSSLDDLRLASALSNLAPLYSFIGFSLKSDELFSHASILKRRAHSSSDVGFAKKDLREDFLTLSNLSSAGNDKPLTIDREAIADSEVNACPVHHIFDCRIAKSQPLRDGEGKHFLIEKVNCMVNGSLRCLFTKIQRMRTCSKTLKQRQWNLNMARVMFLFWWNFHQALGQQI